MAGNLSALFNSSSSFPGMRRKYGGRKKEKGRRGEGEKGRRGEGEKGRRGEGEKGRRGEREERE